MLSANWIALLQLLSFAQNSLVAKMSKQELNQDNNLKSGNCESLQHEDRQSFWTLITRQQRTNSTLLQPPLDSATPTFSQVRIFWRLVGIYQYSRPYFHCSCAETALFELPVKIVTLDSDPRFPRRWQYIRRSVDVFRCFSLYRSKICHISISDLFDLMILNVVRSSRITLTKFDVGQPICY